jgi:hypothetical protein
MIRKGDVSEHFACTRQYVAYDFPILLEEFMGKHLPALILIASVFIAAPIMANENIKSQGQNTAKQNSDQQLAKKQVRLRLRRVLM